MNKVNLKGINLGKASIISIMVAAVLLMTNVCYAAAYTLYDSSGICKNSMNFYIKTLPPKDEGSVSVKHVDLSIAQYDDSNVVSDGYIGRAVYLNGNNQNYVYACTGNEYLNFGTGDISILCWVKTTQSYASVLDKRDTTGYHIAIYNGKPLFQMAASTKYENYWNSSGVSVNDGNWHMIAITVDRDSLTGGKIYVDGTVACTFNPTGVTGSLDTTAEFTLGKHRDNSWPYQGYIDELYMSKRVLTSDEISGIYSAGTSGFTVR